MTKQSKNMWMAEAKAAIDFPEMEGEGQVLKGQKITITKCYINGYDYVFWGNKRLWAITHEYVEDINVIVKDEINDKQ